eukprot:s497_g4.t2
MDSLAGRISVESVAGQALSRTAENWRRAARLFQGKPADESEEVERPDSAALPSKVQEALAEAMSDAERQSTLRRLLKEYHPDQNPGEEDPSGRGKPSLKTTYFRSFSNFKSCGSDLVTEL